MSVQFSMDQKNAFPARSRLSRDWKRWSALADDEEALAMRQATALDLIVILRSGNTDNGRATRRMLDELDPASLSGTGKMALGKDALVKLNAWLAGVGNNGDPTLTAELEDALRAAAADLGRQRARTALAARKLKDGILQAPTTCIKDLAIKLDVAMCDDNNFGDALGDDNSGDQQITRAMIASVRDLLPDFEFTSLRRLHLTDSLRNA